MDSLRLDRRRLLQAGAAGAAGAAAVTLATPGAAPGPFAAGVAAAAPLPKQLQRATWLALGDRDLTLGDDAATLTLIAVEDLPIAATIAALRGHDGAFALRFSGPSGIAPATHTLRSAQLGAIDLLLGPVGAADGATQRYEAIVDRTIRIAGVNEEDEPIVLDPGARAEQPAAMAPPAAVVATTRRAAARRGPPRLRGLELTRGRHGRVLVAEAALQDAQSIVAVRAVLRVEGKVVARARAAVRGSRRARLRFVAAEGSMLPRRAELTLALVARDGRVTRIRRRVRA